MSKDDKAKPDWQRKYEADLDRGLRGYDKFGPTRETRLSDEQIVDFVTEVFNTEDILERYKRVGYYYIHLERADISPDQDENLPGDDLIWISSFELWFCFRIGRSRDHLTFIVPRRVIWELLELGNRNPKRQDVLLVLTEMRE